MGFTQYFGSALQLTPHHHVLFDEGLWDEAGEFVALPPPCAEDVEVVLRRVLRQLAKDLEDVESPWPEDDFQGLVAQAAQAATGGGKRAGHAAEAPAAGGARGARGQPTGAGVAVPLRKPRTGSDGAATVREDGKYAYRTRKGQVLVFTAEQLVKRLIALLPPRPPFRTRG